ncbi:hypothetical protein PWT90_05354 [Aphanocladium album]|nr:hypothetical protein PWT90_05354 [Aphanocladium album]
MLPSEEALGLPEILTNVLSSLPRADLAAAVRVSRLWFECGIVTLWHDRPRVQVLADAAASGSPRAALYAAQVEVLGFSGDEEGALHRSLAGLAFPRLRSLRLDSYRPADGVYPVAQYLGGALRRLDFYGGPLSAATLDALRERCGGGLRQLLVDSLGGEGVTPAAFYRLLAGCRRLRLLAVLYHMEEFLTHDLVVLLAGFEDLEELYAGNHRYDVALWERVAAEVETPFPRLRALQVALTPAAVRVLVRMIPRMEDLKLVLSAGGPEPVVRSLTTTTTILTSSLKCLSLKYPDNTDVDRNELKALAQLKALEELTVTASLPSPRANAFDDDDFIALFAELGGLRTLQFEIRCRLSATSLYSLAESCPRLRAVTMVNTFYLRDMDDRMKPGVVFAALEELDLDGLIGNRLPNMIIDDEGDAVDQVDLFLRFMPKLRELYLANFDVFSLAVGDNFDVSVLHTRSCHGRTDTYC